MSCARLSQEVPVVTSAASHPQYGTVCLLLAVQLQLLAETALQHPPVPVQQILAAHHPVHLAVTAELPIEQLKYQRLVCLLLTVPLMVAALVATVALQTGREHSMRPMALGCHPGSAHLCHTD